MSSVECNERRTTGDDSIGQATKIAFVVILPYPTLFLWQNGATLWSQFNHHAHSTLTNMMQFEQANRIQLNKVIQSEVSHGVTNPSVEKQVETMDWDETRIFWSPSRNPSSPFSVDEMRPIKQEAKELICSFLERASTRLPMARFARHEDHWCYTRGHL